MPEACCAMLDGKGMTAIDNKLQDILDCYELDFAKYAVPKEIPRINAIWHCLPSQLAKVHRKFIYKIIKTGARSKDYKDALMWLEDAGIIYRIYSISRPGIPLSAYAQPDAFKVYACDCGLLRVLASISANVIVDPIANYSEFKGAMAENAALQGMIHLLNDRLPYYWYSGETAEIEFVCEFNELIVPVEVKAEGNTNGRSLTVYDEKYHPQLRIRFSSLNLQYNGNLLSVPSALLSWTDKLITLVRKSVL